MYVSRNIVACSCNHCCGGKAVGITYSEVVFIALGYPACNAHAPDCQLWSALMYSIFPNYLINGRIFEKKRAVEHKMCVLILLYNF